MFEVYVAVLYVLDVNVARLYALEVNVARLYAFELKVSAAYVLPTMVGSARSVLSPIRYQYVPLLNNRRFECVTVNVIVSPAERNVPSGSRIRLSADAVIVNVLARVRLDMPGCSSKIRFTTAPSDFVTVFVL